MHTVSSLAIQITSAKRTRKRIEIGWSQGESAFDLAERANPLPAFGAALDALAPVALRVCGLPDTYGEDGLAVKGFAMGKHSGTPTVSIILHVTLPDADKALVIRTPERMLGIPATEGSYSPPLKAADVALVDEAVEQAKAYVRGERAQGEIDFGPDEEDEDGEDGEDGENTTASLEFSSSKP